MVSPASHGRRTLLRASALIAGVAAVGATELVTSPAADAATTDTLKLGWHLLPGVSIRSRNGVYSAAMRKDGNFVIYGPGGFALWATNSTGWIGASLTLATNGNIVLRTAAKVLWASGTSNRGAVRLTLGNDGYLRLFNAVGKSLWSTKGLPRPRIAPPPKPPPPPPPAPTPPPPLPSDQLFALHVLRRTTFGVTPELLADVSRAGSITAWLAGQLAPSTIADTACDSMLTRFPMAFLDPPAAYAQLVDNWDGMEQLVLATLSRQLWSKRQLFEVMVDFWSNHLNITTPSSEPWATKMWDDRNVIRANALGRFDNMLVASMTSPAMLLYLNNAESRGDDVNENYGRELLELHTVGVDAGYGHDGVINAARTLSGFSVWNEWNGGTTANYGTYRYVPQWHYVGPVQVLGWSHPNADMNAGPAAAESLARYLAIHPMTARRIATKLATRFVSDTPSQALVDSLAQVYIANQTAIIPVLQALFSSAEFAASVGAKFRRPAEDMIATVRALGITPDLTTTSVNAVTGWRWALANMGNAPLAWDQPNGYPDVASAWASTGMTLARWNGHLGLTQNWWDGGVIAPNLASRLLGTTLPATRGALIDTLTSKLLPGFTIASAHRSALIAFLGPDGPLGNGDTTWLFPVLVAMVLDSPYWSAR